MSYGDMLRFYTGERLWILSNLSGGICGGLAHGDPETVRRWIRGGCPFGVPGRGKRPVACTHVGFASGTEQGVAKETDLTNLQVKAGGVPCPKPLGGEIPRHPH